VKKGSAAAKAQSAAAKAANAKRAASKISARLTATDAQRIQSATAQQNNGKVQGGSFASRAQSAADKHDMESDR